MIRSKKHKYVNTVAGQGAATHPQERQEPVYLHIQYYV